MKRSIVRRTNVDFCKRVEVWQGYRIIDRYLTMTVTFDKYYTFKLTKL